MDDDEDWTLPAADIGSIVVISEAKVRRKIVANPIGFLHFDKPGRGVKAAPPWDEQFAKMMQKRSQAKRTATISNRKKKR